MVFHVNPLGSRRCNVSRESLPKKRARVSRESLPDTKACEQSVQYGLIVHKANQPRKNIGGPAQILSAQLGLIDMRQRRFNARDCPIQSLFVTKMADQARFTRAEAAFNMAFEPL